MSDEILPVVRGKAANALRDPPFGLTQDGVGRIPAGIRELESDLAPIPCVCRTGKEPSSLHDIEDAGEPRLRHVNCGTQIRCRTAGNPVQKNKHPYLALRERSGLSSYGGKDRDELFVEQRQKTQECSCDFQARGRPAMSCRCHSIR